MDKKKNFKILLAGFVMFCVMQSDAPAAQTQPPQLKPRVQVTNSTSVQTTVQQSASSALQTSANTVSQTQTAGSSSQKLTVPKRDIPSDIRTPKEQTFKGQTSKGQTYKDSEGNPISKEQKDRSAQLKKTYKGVTKDEHIMEALELLKGGLGDFSRRAILGNNLSGKPMQIDFEDLSKFGQAYANFDALGWKKKDRLYIYINKKHQDAPKPALAAVLSHEALHQDDFNSLNEETYAWTMEAAVWTQLSEKDPRYNDSMHPLAVRENTLKKLFIKGNYTSKYIRKTVFSNPGYANLPSRSPGFEDDNL